MSVPTPPQPQPQYIPAAPAKPARPWYKKKRFDIPLGLFAFFVIVGMIGGGAEEPATADTSGGTTPSASAEVSPSAEDVAAKKAAVEAKAAEDAKAAADKATKDAEAAAAAAAAQAEAAAAAAAKADPASYAAISARDYALVVKSPDTHIGEKFVLYGYISQFDSATGPDAFLAQTAGEQKGDWYEYDVNTAVQTEDAALLANVVQDDLVKMHVQVVGSFSYDTQAGGNTTVPKVQVNIIEVTGSTTS